MVDWRWCRWVWECHRVLLSLLAARGAGAPDLIVFNVGFWHLRSRPDRDPLPCEGDAFGLQCSLDMLLRDLRAFGGAAQQRVLWRGYNLLEMSEGRWFNNDVVRQHEALAMAKWAGAGFATVPVAHLTPPSSNGSRVFTVEGFHPERFVYRQHLKEVLQTGLGMMEQRAASAAAAGGDGTGVASAVSGDGAGATAMAAGGAGAGAAAGGDVAAAGAEAPAEAAAARVSPTGAGSSAAVPSASSAAPAQSEEPSAAPAPSDASPSAPPAPPTSSLAASLPAVPSEAASSAAFARAPVAPAAAVAAAGAHRPPHILDASAHLLTASEEPPSTPWLTAGSLALLLAWAAGVILRRGWRVPAAAASSDDSEESLAAHSTKNEE